MLVASETRFGESEIDHSSSDFSRAEIVEHDNGSECNHQRNRERHQEQAERALPWLGAGHHGRPERYPCLIEAVLFELRVCENPALAITQAARRGQVAGYMGPLKQQAGNKVGLA